MCKLYTVFIANHKLTLLSVLSILVDSSDEDNALPPLYHSTPERSNHCLPGTEILHHIEPRYNEDIIVIIMNENLKTW